MGLTGITYHISSLGSIPHISLLVLLHSDDFCKTELLMGIFQLITLKVLFRAGNLEKHLSVIACWNWGEKIYRAR